MQGLHGITKFGKMGRQDHSPEFQECPVVREALALLEVPRNKQPERARPGPGRGQAGVRQGSGRGRKMVGDKTEKMESLKGGQEDRAGNKQGGGDQAALLFPQFRK